MCVGGGGAGGLCSKFSLLVFQTVSHGRDGWWIRQVQDVFAILVHTKIMKLVSWNDSFRCTDNRM